MAMHLHNTLTHSLEPFVAYAPARVSFYSCGPTVYDDAHIGNFRAFLAADLLRRWLESPLCTIADLNGAEHTGPRRVRHVMNITDVGHMTDDANADGSGEDKMQLAGERLALAKKAGTLHTDADIDPSNPRAIAAFYARRFMEDACKLGLKVAIEAEEDPSLMPFASDNVPGMIAMIEKLIDKGFAYRSGPAVYFDVQRFADYGRLSGNTLDQLQAGAGGRVSQEDQQSKKHPADFLLWKADPSHIMKWDSPWGTGYPGWHIECSVMSLNRLAEGGLDAILSGSGHCDDPTFIIDLHSGGEDNIFPHHECERAQSCALTGCDHFARQWFHARFLLVEGTKMSKSKGNFFTARDLFARGIAPDALRLELIKTHYRANANFTEQGLKDSRRMIDRWRMFLEKAKASAMPGHEPHAMLGEFADALHDDLNIAGALGVLNSWINATDSPTRADGAALEMLDRVLGVLELQAPESKQTSIGVFLGVAPSPEVESLLIERLHAKEARDYARADAIRDQLREQGLAIKDVPGGQVEVTPL